jgi:hypothetical protein
LPIAAGSVRKGMMVTPLLNAFSSCRSIRSDRPAYSVKTTIMILQAPTALEMDWSKGTLIFRSRGRIQHRIPTDSSSLQIALAVDFPSVEWLITTSCGICGAQSSASNLWFGAVSSGRRFVWSSRVSAEPAESAGSAGSAESAESAGPGALISLFGRSFLATDPSNLGVRYP